MAIINFRDFKYSKENIFFDLIKDRIGEILSEHPDLELKINTSEHNFYNLLSESVQIDGHYLVKSVIRQIKRHLNLELDIRIFLYQSSTCHAACAPRTILDSNTGEQKLELVIIVSQHFFNNLGESERVSLIGHELAHMIYKHIDVPVVELLNEKFDLEYIEDFKSSLLKWSICKEITADLFALVVSDFDKYTVCRGFIKFVTGLTDVHGDDLITMSLSQFDEISKSVYHHKLSTHPNTPLRIKIINEVSKLRIVDYYNKDVSEDFRLELVNELNETVDSLVRQIYPEITGKNVFHGFDIMFNMSVAVALSDGEISLKEIEIINDISETSFDANEILNEIVQKVQKGSYQDVVEELIELSINQTISLGLNRSQLVQLLRHLVILAASDGKIEKEELITINNYFSTFGFNKMDVITVIISSNLKLN